MGGPDAVILVFTRAEAQALLNNEASPELAKAREKLAVSVVAPPSPPRAA